ncbi:MAG: AAA family ATPase [Clostridiales bacterium]|nr:AAA family ATPase [Clostridiales bacterium]
MCKVISVISSKGGVGKTVSAVNISAYMQMHGKRVCAVDLDPLHNLTKHFGIHPGNLKDHPTIYDMLLAALNDCDEEEFEQVAENSICHSSTADVIPATSRLSSIESIMNGAAGRDRLLDYVLSFIRDKYDYIIIDCHPGSDLYAINALTASDTVLIPVEAHVLSSDRWRNWFAQLSEN